MGTIRQQTRPDGSWTSEDANAEEENFVTDMFAGHTVSGPAPGGGWGVGTNPATNYNTTRTMEEEQLFNLGLGANQDAQARAGAADQAAIDAQGRAAPATDWTGANAAAARGLEARGGTQATLNALNQFAGDQTGRPSAAQAAIQQAANDGTGRAMALAKSGRGFGGNAAAQGQAQQTVASTTANAANAGAQTAAAEDAAAQQRRLAALNTVLGGGIQQQGQDLASQGQFAGQAQFDVNAQLQNRGQNDAFSTAQNQLGLGYAQHGQQTLLGMTGAGTDRLQLGQNALNSQAQYELEQQQMELDAQKANQASDTERDAANTNTFGSMLTMFGLSDERVKELEGREAALSAALETVGNAPGYSYRYKDPSQPGAKPGRQVGPMAQDLERGPLGDTLVMETPQGKMVDQGRLSMVNSSAITELNRKIQALEAALGKAA